MEAIFSRTDVRTVRICGRVGNIVPSEGRRIGVSFWSFNGGKSDLKERF